MTAETAIQAFALAAFGAGSLLLGYGFAHQKIPGRAGFSRENFNSWYHHTYRPLGWPLRNAVFAWIPFGLVLMLGAAIAVMLPILPSPQATDRAQALMWLVAASVVLVPTLVLLAVSFVALVRPPKWLKPAWLREDEKRLDAGLPSLVPIPPEGDRPVISRRDVTLVYAMSGALLLGVFLLRWPPALLLGPAVALPMVGRAKIG